MCVRDRVGDCCKVGRVRCGLPFAKKTKKGSSEPPHMICTVNCNILFANFLVAIIPPVTSDLALNMCVCVRESVCRCVFTPPFVSSIL